MRIYLSLLIMTGLAGCESTGTDSGSTASEAASQWRGRHVQTTTFGATDNSEVVKMTPDGQHAVLVASKARKLTLLAVTDQGLEVSRSAVLFADDAGESELTHIDVNSAATYAAVTRTMPVKTDDVLTDCLGSLVFVDIRDADTFGQVLAEVPVGPMPDAVDISPDGRWAVTADEVDYNDGKCPLAHVMPSVSVLEIIGDDPTSATVRARITLGTVGDGVRREPEQVSFGRDSDHVAVTLQDTHELLTFTVSAVLGEGEGLQTLAADSLRIETLPNRSTGAEPWPDGVACFADAQGRDYFVVAGEYNDTFSIYSLSGDFVTQVEITQNQMPSSLPRNIQDWSHAPFRPDSIAPFQYQGHSYLAFSLKHAGAVGVWLVDEVTDIRFVSAVKVGRNDAGTPVTESSVGTEGISAGSNGLVLTANEGESSASLVGPLLD